MAYFKVCVRNARKDNTYPIYIRVTHHRKVGYIKTDKICKAKFVKNGEINDPYIIKDVYILIESYIDKLNKVDIADWDVSRVVEFLRDGANLPSFSDHCRAFVKNICDCGRERSSYNYMSAIRRLEEFSGKTSLRFEDITTDLIKRWIMSLMDRKAMRNSYPRLIKAMFISGCERYNNYSTGEILIKHDPFRVVKIPPRIIPVKRALPVDVLRRLFAMPVPPDLRNHRGFDLPELAKDVCEMMFCLAGINTVDLFKLEKSSLVGDKLCYHRSKTKGRRSDGAYMEITVPDIIKPLFVKYKGEKRLFNFCEKCSSDSLFNLYVNRGLHALSESGGLPYMTSYCFRHSWATIAHTDLGVSLDDVGFCLNHSPALRVTAGYVNMDFSVVDKINAKVIDFIFSEKHDGKSD